MIARLSLRSGWRLLALAAGAVALHADDHVIVSARANADYTQRKFAGDQPKPETYVVMQGNYFSGATVDPSIDHMPFRKIAAYLAPELAKREYWPASDPNRADLLLVVHWGTTMPTVSSLDLMARSNPLPDAAADHDRMAQAVSAESGTAEQGADLLSGLGASANLNSTYADDLLRQQTDENEAAASQATTAQLLGYTATLRKYRDRLLPSLAVETLERTLQQERYFVIVQAYDLARWHKGEPNKAIWTVRLNISSPGNNFDMAMSRMSKAGVEFFGRTTDDIATVRSKTYDGSVKLAPIVILGEIK